jgi:hypothetical protein
MPFVRLKKNCIFIKERKAIAREKLLGSFATIYSHEYNYTKFFLLRFKLYKEESDFRSSYIRYPRLAMEATELFISSMSRHTCFVLVLLAYKVASLGIER